MLVEGVPGLVSGCDYERSQTTKGEAFGTANRAVTADGERFFRRGFKSPAYSYGALFQALEDAAMTGGVDFGQRVSAAVGVGVTVD